MNLDKINIYVGNQLRKYREGLGYSQETFAEICEVSRAYYGRIERGEHSLTIYTLFQICESIATRLEDVFHDLE